MELVGTTSIGLFLSATSGKIHIGALRDQLVLVSVADGDMRRLSLPAGNRLGLVSPEVALPAWVRRPRFKLLQWIDGQRVLCVVSSKAMEAQTVSGRTMPTQVEVVKIGLLTLGR